MAPSRAGAEHTPDVVIRMLLPMYSLGLRANLRPDGYAAKRLSMRQRWYGRASPMVGKGNFVGDFVLPGLQEVAFLRSPLAHATITGVEIPEALAGKVFLREMMLDAADIGSPSSLPTYQYSALPPLASGKVRHVGEAVAMVADFGKQITRRLGGQTVASNEPQPTVSVAGMMWSVLWSRIRGWFGKPPQL